MLEYLSYVVWGYIVISVGYVYLVDRFYSPLSKMSVAVLSLTPTALYLSMIYFVYETGGGFDVVRAILTCFIALPLLYILGVCTEVMLYERDPLYIEREF